MEIKLYKKEGTYFSEKDQKDKPYTNFYIKCNDELIPVEVKYFPNSNCDNRDPGYQGRFSIIRVFAEKLPEKECEANTVSDASVNSDVKPTENGTAF